jgi:predicted Zn-dependent peptidase
VVLVDRPDAPQSVIGVVREGVSAHEPIAPMLDLINTALGGSFTSRLNQNLREDHGWTYGARTAFLETRHQGAFIARAAVVKTATGPALREMLGELDKMAKGGLTVEELAKVRAQDRADLVQTYETVSGISRRLGTLAMLGLPPSFDLEASRARQGATLARLLELARAHVHPESATVVVVGPRVEVVPQLEAIGLREMELWDPEGLPAAKSTEAPQGKKGC